MRDTEILKNAQKESGMKQIDIANVLGVNKATVSTGMRRDRMSTTMFCKYLSIMGFTVMVGRKEGNLFTPIWELAKENE